MKSKIFFVIFIILVSVSVSSAYQLDVYANYVKTLTVDGNTYDLYSVNIYLRDDEGNAIGKNIKLQVGTYIGYELNSYYKTIDELPRYSSVDYLNTIETAFGRYYTYLLVPTGNNIEDISRIYYLEGVFEDNIRDYYILIIIFFAMLTILTAI